MTKENVIANVQASLGSLFTKDDVINCIEMVETPQPQQERKEDYRAFVRMVKDRVLEMIDEIDWHDGYKVEVDDIEYSIRNGNQIEVDCMKVDVSAFQREVQDGIDTLFNDLWAEHEMRVEIVNENN